MRNVTKEMQQKLSRCFLRLQVFLPAVTAIPVVYDRITIQAIFFFAFFRVAQGIILLKIINLSGCCRLAEGSIVILRVFKSSK